MKYETFFKIKMKDAEKILNNVIKLTYDNNKTKIKFDLLDEIKNIIFNSEVQINIKGDSENEKV